MKNLSVEKLIRKLTNHIMSENRSFNKKQKISLRIVLATSFVTQILAIVGIVGWASLHNGEKAVKQLATQLNTEISHHVSQELEDALEGPHLIHQINQDLIKLELLNFNNLKSTGRLFEKQIQQFNVSNIKFGNSEGDFVSFEQNKDGDFSISLMTRLNPGILQEYSTDAQGNLTEKLNSYEYNYLNQSWYTDAVITDKPSWSKIYNWNGLPEVLAISASYPIYDKNNNLIGVLGVEKPLSDISELLKKAKTTHSGVIYIIEKSGLIVASSSEEKASYLVNDLPQRLSVLNSNAPLVRATAKKILETFSELNQITANHHLEFNIDGKKNFVQLTPWQDEFGLEWLILIAVPASEFMVQINENTRITVLFCLLAIALASYLAIFTSRWVTQPIFKLSQATADIAKGSLSGKLEIVSFIEFEGLVQSFNQMSERLNNSFTELEERIEERTIELKISEEKFYRIFHYSPVSMMILRLPELDIIDINEGFREIFSYSKEEIIGQNCVEVNLFKNSTIYEEIIQTLQSTGKVSDREIEIYTKLGAEKIIELSAEKIEIDKKNCIIYVLNDITKRRQAEIERDRFFDISVDLLAIAGTDGYFKRLNPSWSTKLGYSIEELLAVPYIEFIHPEDRENTLTEARKVTEGDSTYNFQNRYRTRDGCYRWLTWNIIPFQEEGLIYALARDITDEKEALLTLRRSQTQLAEAQKFAHIGSWENDLTTGEIIWSEELYNIFGLDPNLSSVTEEDYLKLVHPDDLPALQKAIELAINHGESYEFDRRIITPDSSLKHLSLTGKPIINNEGKVIKLFGTVLDITERKQTEIALRESEERFRQLAENIDSVFWMRDIYSNQIIYISPSYEKIWGRSHQQLYASPKYFLDTVHPEDHLRVSEYIANSAQTKEEQLEYRILRPNDEIRWIWDRSFPIKNQAGEVYRIAGIAEDISENKLAQVELKLSQERLQLALEASGDGLWDWNISTGEFYYSSQCLKMLGYEENELLGQVSSWQMLIHPEDKGWVMDALNLHLEDSSFIYAFDYRLRTKSNQWKWIATYGKVVSRDETDKPLRMLGTHKDISDRKAAEVALESQVALEQLVSSISTSFINLDPEQIDSSIELALQQLGELTGADRSYMFLNNEEQSYITNTHEWCAEGIEPLIENLQYIPQDNIPWFMKKMYKFEVIHIPLVAELPSEANIEKQRFLAQSIQSLLCIPMISGSQFIGFVGFDAVRQPYTWRDSTINLLKIIAEIFTRALEYQETELALRESEQRFRIMADSAPVLIWMSATDNLCNYFNQTWLNFTGRSLAQEVESGWIEGVHPEDMQQCLETYVSNFHRHEAFTMEYRLRRADGEYRWVLATGVPRFNLDGNFVGYIGSCIDISDRKQAEEQIQASLQEKEILLKEIHHRVKNNLHVISNLLDLQSDYIEDKKVQELFADSQNRIQTMALIHEQLYQSKDLGEIDFSEYLHTLIDNLFFSYGDRASTVQPIINVEPITLNIETAIPCGLLINELVTNSFKHAFPNNKSGEVCIELNQDTEQKIYLTIRDNGIGIPADFDWQNTSSLGLKLVRILSKQLKAEIEFDASNGTLVHLTFFPLKYKDRF
ncbi:MAG: PAS domain-containing protein [Microcoleaceae cyanobacterium]